MATDGEHSDCQWLDLREHLQETMMFSSRFMFVFPVKFSMKNLGCNDASLFLVNEIYFSSALQVFWQVWLGVSKIDPNGERQPTSFSTANNHQKAKHSGFTALHFWKTSLTSLDLHKHCLHISTQPRVKKAKTFCNIKASLKRGKNNYHETTSKTIQPVKVLQCLGPSTAHEFSGTFHTVQNIAIAIVKGIPIVSWINLVLHSPNFQWHSTVSFG